MEFLTIFSVLTAAILKIIAFGDVRAALKIEAISSS
jgi:hypothetical protein